MTKEQYRKAWEADQRKKAAARAERMIVPGYPADHNPYIAHSAIASCYAGCILDSRKEQR